MIDSEKVKNEVFGSTEEKTTGLSQERITDIVKVAMGKRTYISDPSEAPEGANVQQGERGGYYIEDDGGSGSSDDGDARRAVAPNVGGDAESEGSGFESGGSMAQEEAVGHFEDFIDDIDVANPQDDFEMEASQIWSDFTQGMIGEQEFEEQAEEFITEYAEETLG